MSSFGGGFGGFGSNNQQPSSGFGGFGANNNTTSSGTFNLDHDKALHPSLTANRAGFGTNTAAGFGATSNTGGGMFGNTSSTPGGFGSTPGGFGSNTGGFGNKPAFGTTPTPSTTTTASGGLFGGSSTPSSTGTGFGGFGSTANTTTPSAFGSNNTGSGLFGNANKPTGGFGTANTSSSLFGGGNANTAPSTGTGFGNFGSTNTLGGGGATGDPPGTAVTPFQAFAEKEPNSTTNQSNAFQSILFQDPYRKWSADELRLADYAQGRRHGNPSGAGAFGVSSGFGSFGPGNQTNAANTPGGFGVTSNTAGGLFGSNTNTSNATSSGFGGFGANNNTAASSTGSGLFGNANKPSGGLFGNTTQNQSGTMFGSGGTTAGTTGFGSTNTTGGGLFSSATNAASNAGGGLFGNNAQNKPAGTGFSFGNANTAAGGFGGATNSSFGPAANNAGGGGLFGNANANAQPSGGLFGNNNQQQQNASGGLFGQNQNQQSGGLFGNNQQKPATGGIFGSTPAVTNTNSGLFAGNTNQQQGTTGLGGTNTNTGGLFGAKPATSAGLFGSNTATQGNTGGSGLFGGVGANAQTQQATGTGLFGSAANQQKPGLFGSAPSTAGGGMFGNSTAQNQGGIFSNAGSQQQQSIGLGSSLLGGYQQVNNAPQGLTANLNDVSAYGSPSLFSGVSGNEIPNPGPLAVPLSGQPKPKRPSIFPMHKFTPAASGRFGTPQKRGFGFSYSSYGTPGGGSPASLSGTPSTLGRSLLGATSSGTALSKSMSSSNLRRTINADDSILLPGAFSNTNSTRWYGSTGSKKLVINRELRSDLFSTPQRDKQNGDNGTGPRKLSKRVSFDTNVDGEDSPPVRAALPAPGDVPETPAEETPRQDKATPITNGLRTPEMEQAKGKDKELTIVQEEDSATPEPQTNGFDNAPGKYWMEPSREELQNMNRIQRQRIDNFTVGRENVGSITFKIPVDISAIDLDELCGGIIQLEPRSATVYPIAAKKPPVGKGLNVPARISLEQSWPRGGRDRRVTSDPKRFNKHIERLKRIVDTAFENYDVNTGVWTFSVEHFTTYGLDDSDEETDFDITLDPPVAAPLSTIAPPVTFHAPTSSRDDDMMEFSQSHMLPGAFDEQQGPFAAEQTGRQSFLGVSSADSATHDVKLSLESDDIAEYDMSEDEDMTRSSLGQHLAAEHDDASSEGGQDIKRATATPGGILRARMRAMKDSVGPVKLEVADGDDWMEMLRKTVSPMKRDRHMLRELAGSASRQGGKTVTFDIDDEPDFRKSSIWGRSIARPDRKDGLATGTQIGMDQGRGFATSIDLMNSLFEKPKPKPACQEFNASLSGKGFPKWPYQRQTKILTAEDGERAFHSASRPTWGPDETLVLIRSLDGSHLRRSIRDTTDILTFQRSSIQTEEQDIRLATFTAESSKKFLLSQDTVTEIRVVEGVPYASLHTTSLKSVFHHKNMNDAASIHEKQVWELASILFDNLDGLSSTEEEHLVRRNKLSRFWSDLVEQASSTAIGLAATSEEKALACLAGHRIAEACKHLLDGKNFRLATLVPLIGTSDVAKREMREQIKSWLDSKMLSEFSEAIRTIYELLSGNVCACEGLKGMPNEDRVESFVISKNFGLDWRQSFGLRLWYAISNDDDLSIAVEKFTDDIGQDKEDLPRPWYVEQGIAPLWDDANIATRQDLLWGLLQLYADHDADLEAVLRPENSQLSPLDARLRWQLGIALTSTGKVSYGTNGVEKADAATLAYAAQLTRAGEWLEAAFVLLHLHHTAARKKALQEHLCQHANLIGFESDANFVILTEKCRIPAAWIWEALALYMRCVRKDAVAEVQCLLRAGSHVEAHRILVQHVAPQAIIERDYAGLSLLISQFQGRQQGITEWTQGGEIYGHFLQLIDCRGKGESVPPAVLDRLLAGLNAMKDIGVERNITRYAAISDMADETAREIVKLTRQKQDMELRSRILSLPLTQDRLLAYSVDLSLDRYREVMSH
ncbi:nuclear protein 96 domain-containing protein [Trichoderma ceciliae]